jgi:DNA replication initiation complex subunit (GINS family)
VPTLDELDRLKPGESRLFRGVDWNFYERVHEVVEELQEGASRPHAGTTSISS